MVWSDAGMCPLPPFAFRIRFNKIFSPAVLAFCALAFLPCHVTAQDNRVVGTVWQPDLATVNPLGNWQRLGAQQLLVQWTAVDGMAFVVGSEVPVVQGPPDWQRIAKEPWAREVILGLAGDYSEPRARSNVEKLGTLSRALARLPTPLNVVAWYFPVEADPTWPETARLANALAHLPRPLWISVYDNGNIGGVAFSEWVASWLPADVGVFLQDGVGLHTREPAVALDYFHAVANRLGPGRVRMIAEAFRPNGQGAFRAASAQELTIQLTTYRGLPVYLFDGPHYVSDSVVESLVRQPRGTGSR